MPLPPGTDTSASQSAPPPTPLLLDAAGTPCSVFPWSVSTSGCPRGPVTVAKATTAWYFVKFLGKSHRTLRVRKYLGVYLAQPPVLILSTSWQERGGLLNWLFGIYSLKENS